MTTVATARGLNPATHARTGYNRPADPRGGAIDASGRRIVPPLPLQPPLDVGMLQGDCHAHVHGQANGDLDGLGDLWVCAYCEHDIYVNRKILKKKEQKISNKA